MDNALCTGYPLAMNRSVEDMIIVTDAASEEFARAEGYLSGHEFYAKFNAGESAEPAKTVAPTPNPVRGRPKLAR